MKKTQWTKAKETLKNMILAKTVEFEKDIKDYETLKKATLNGFTTFKRASYGGRFIYSNYELAKLFCTPKQFEKLENRKQFPQGIGGESWLDIQARALSQCVLELAKDRGYKLPSYVVFNEIENRGIKMILSNQIKELTDFLDAYNIEYTITRNRAKADTINLANRDIKRLPDSIGLLKCKRLILDDNALTKLPDSIIDMECDSLELSYNNITSLPENIGNLKSKDLYLSFNNIKSLPESIGYIKSQTLWLDGNDISRLPNSFLNIRCRYLSLRYNELTAESKQLLKNLKRTPSIFMY